QSSTAREPPKEIIFKMSGIYKILKGIAFHVSEKNVADQVIALTDNGIRWLRSVMDARFSRGYGGAVFGSVVENV
ncbi:MAG: hypothetical protein K2G94_03125, partial [Muribaculaceae bacterium]|nr:hypothetical protein [Muribaculaceae bacterium]